jgi:hypothetical protein
LIHGLKSAKFIRISNETSDIVKVINKVLFLDFRKSLKLYCKAPAFVLVFFPLPAQKYFL